MPIRAAEARATLREEQAAGKQYLTSTLHEMNKTTLTKLSYFNRNHRQARGCELRAPCVNCILLMPGDPTGRQIPRPKSGKIGHTEERQSR